MINTARNIFDTLNGNVNYVHFKSTEHLDESFKGNTDFDLLVDRNDAVIMEQILGQNNGKRFIGNIGNVYPGVDDWLIFDDSGKLLHFHVHYQLVTGKNCLKHVVLPWEKVALETKVFNSRFEIFTVSPEFELCELFTRILLKSSLKRTLSSYIHGLKLFASEKAEREHILRQINKLKLTEMANKLFEGCQIEDLILFIMKGDLIAKEYQHAKNILSGFENQNSRIQKSFYLKSFCITELRNIRLRNKSKGKFENGMLKKSSHTGGVIISFVGSDGAGKSTVYEDIIKWLGWKIDIASLYMGSSQIQHYDWVRSIRSIGNFFNIKKILAKHSPTDKETNVRQLSEMHSGNVKPIPKTMKNWFLQYLNYRFSVKTNKNIKRILKYKLNGGIMILDRYPQTQIDGVMDGAKVNPCFAKLYKKEKKQLKISETVQPDVVFMLDVPLDVAIVRKPDHSPEMLKEKINVCKSLNFSHAKVVHIDTTQPYEDEIIQIKKYIWNSI